MASGLTPKKPEPLERTSDSDEPASDPKEAGKQPMSSNKNRHTIQVEYDGEASYERLQEELHASKRPKGADGKKPALSVPMIDVPQASSSDVEMESGDSDIGHGHRQDSSHTPETTEILTPPAATPAPGTVSEETIPEAPLDPVTPSRKGKATEQVTSPSTPRPTTPRADASAITPKASRVPKSSDASSFPTSLVEAPSPSAGLNAAGLPKVPPPKRDRSRKGMSLDKFGLSKLLGQSTTSLVHASKPPPSAGGQAKAIQESKRQSMVRPRTADSDASKDKKSRRKTLQLMVNRGPSPRETRSAAPTPTSAASPLSTRDMNPKSPVIDAEGIQPAAAHDRNPSSPSIVTVDAAGSPHQHKTASSSAAKKVMDWFRRKSLAKDTLTGLKTAGARSDSTYSFVRVSESLPRSTLPSRTAPSEANLAMSSTSSIAPTAEDVRNPTVVVMEPARQPLESAVNKVNIGLGLSSPNVNKSSIINDSLRMPPPPSPSYSEQKMRVHTGLVDQSALSSKPPKEVVVEVLRVLQEMGMDIKKENDFRFRCTRPRRKKAGATTGLGLSSVMSTGSGLSPFSLMGNASTSRTDSRGLPMPQSPSSGLLSSGGLKGMLLRRGSSYNSSTSPGMMRSESEIMGSPSASSTGYGSPQPQLGAVVQVQVHEPIYGEHSVDNGDEVKFNVELCRIKNLPGLYLLNIKRLKGSVWSFKFIYQTVIERSETLTH
ncbi:hypothetical protein P7C73_g5776, partial [Tremellales sp. Uapishka_1]